MPTPAGADAGAPKVLDGTAFGHAVWRLWPWLSWLLPGILLLAALNVLLENADNGALALFLYTPIMFMGAGTLSMVPRWILQARGQRTVVAPVIACFITTWLAAIAVVIAAVGRASLSERGAVVLSLVAPVLMVAAWVTCVVCAAVLPRDKNWGRWTLSGPLSLVAVPLALTILVAAQSPQPIPGGPDGDGALRSDAASLNGAQALQQQTQRWDTAQHLLSPLRETVCPEGWRLDGTSGVTIFEGDLYEASRYAVTAGWVCTIPVAAEEFLDQLVPAAESAGWELTVFDDAENPRVSFWEDGATGEQTEGVQADLTCTVSADGQQVRPSRDSDADGRSAEKTYRLSMSLEPIGSDSALHLRLRLTSPMYWLEGERVDWGEDTDRARREHLIWADPPPLFAADEWPELALLMSGS